MAGNNSDNQSALGRIADIAQEYAPGRWRECFTVPVEIVEVIDYSPNLPPVPDSLKRTGNEHINPKPVEASEDNERTTLSPRHQTHRSDVHGKYEKGDRELPTKNVKIPSSPAKGQKDPASYTAQYMPKS